MPYAFQIRENMDKYLVLLFQVALDGLKQINTILEE
jgi:hypothetical protein